ncbi:sigma-54 dependent transcriptional regulator [Alphaproteobacteria bacterium]|jgi:two-component system, NtrC family, nitrogen regulation response regulator NtrX|nr:sigma-54-dependent Fis family transcriptional regulator [Alphaproteobacteria bacterium]MDC0462030.1 sigma-54 dependent transcriptional regulator [Alphaproteobacteria bacterium]
MSEEILIVDDEPDIRSLLSLTLEDEGFSSAQAANAQEARDIVSKKLPSCAILDIWMRDSDMDGLELLNWCKEIYPDMPILMISGHGTISTAVEAIRNGAYDFVEKPFKAERLLLTVKRALQAKKLEVENQLLRNRTAIQKQPDLIGNSAKIKQLKNDVEKIAPTASRVLIQGRPGSGKETVARLIHEKSSRSEHPFVVVSCSRLSGEKADAELFGSEIFQYGRRIVGLLEQAHLGTIYFDEICDLSQAMQARILRAVTEQRFRRVGGSAEIVSDVRIISATNNNPIEMIKKGRLREDLYYRLAVVNVLVPELSQRREDIPLLAKYFVQQQAELLGKRPVKLGDDLLNALRSLAWPGSVRQLKNIIETIMILSSDENDEPISVSALPELAQNQTLKTERQDLSESFLSSPLREAREKFERIYFLSQLERFDGNISQMARFVEMERSALHRKLKSIGVSDS